MAKATKGRKALAFIKKYPLTALWKVQEALEIVCPSDGECEKCNWKDLCCPLKDLEYLNEQG